MQEIPAFLDLGRSEIAEGALAEGSDSVQVDVHECDASLPKPPTDEEVFRYFSKPRKRSFTWLFFAQCCLIYSYCMVMRRDPHAWPGFILLTFMVPPVVVNFWLRVQPHRAKLSDHKQRVQDFSADPGEFPSVDVFLPCCGEDNAVLRNTFANVANLVWKGTLRVLVLDDSGLPRVQALAHEFGFSYTARPNRGEWKKAGNLIHGFDATEGEFVTVFDADFAPRPDFLLHTIPYMSDPATGVVQTAQYFEKLGTNYFAQYAGALQELFFRWIQPARDVYEAAICAGTNVVYRREAVVAAGGFAKVPLGEDVHSGVKIWVANYRTRYVPIVLAKGLAPDSWRALTNQQYRWCRSSMLLMVSGFFKDAPFSRRQRVCFWAAFLYYMASAMLPITSALPTLIMVWFFPQAVKPLNYLPLLPAFVSTFVVFPRLAKGWDLGIYRVSTVNSMSHLLAVTDALRQRIAAWIPTGSASAKQTAKIPNVGPDVPLRAAILLRVWFALVQVLLWSGIVRAIQTNSPLAYGPAIALAFLQLVTLGPMVLHLEPGKRRQTPRRPGALRASTLVSTTSGGLA